MHEDEDYFKTAWCFQELVGEQTKNQSIIDKGDTNSFKKTPGTLPYAMLPESPECEVASKVCEKTEVKVRSQSQDAMEENPI